MLTDRRTDRLKNYIYRFIQKYYNLLKYQYLIEKIISSLQKQLESERNSRRKLENYIRKQMKASDGDTHMSPNNLNLSANDNGHGLIEHESSI
jgi:hypothetical protein